MANTICALDKCTRVDNIKCKYKHCAANVLMWNNDTYDLIYKTIIIG